TIDGTITRRVDQQNPRGGRYEWSAGARCADGRPMSIPTLVVGFPRCFAASGSTLASQVLSRYLPGMISMARPGDAYPVSILRAREPAWRPLPSLGHGL